MWATGTWAAGLWATGTWAGATSQPTAVQPAQTFGGGGEDAAERDRLFREHWDYLDGARSVQVQIADDIRGARTVELKTATVVPESILPPSMRGTVPPTRVADVIGDPLILAALALLIDEADD